MTAIELQTARLVLGWSASELARQLDTPLRTYQDWEAGVNRIPGIAGVAVRLLSERDKWVMGNVLANIDARIRADFEGGVRG